MPPDVGVCFDGRLVEPFVGGAAMFLFLEPKEAVLADVNEELINLYKAVRGSLPDLRTELDRLHELPHTAEAYYEVRSWEPTESIQRAARTVYLNRNGFNGLYRVNRHGHFNVPFGRYRSKPRLYNAENIEAVSALLQRAELVVAPFEDVMRRLRPGDFAYLDPPYYPVSATSSFTSYTSLDFDLGDQRRLRDAILQAHERTEGKARIMLSNSTAPDLVALYENQPELHITMVSAMRALSAKASGRGAIEEIVVRNYH